MRALPLEQQATRRSVFLAICWLYACIHLDRQILGILAQSIKSDLNLTDRQLGLLSGSAFAIVYALLGLYFGRRADATDRLTLVRRAAWVWSLSCAAGAMAFGFIPLLLCRAGLAVGQAMATGAAVSLIAELAGEKYRGRLASLFLTMAFVGAGAASVIGGTVIELFERSSSLVGWRAAFVAAGAPGLLGALYLSCLGHESRRTGVQQRPVGVWFGSALIGVSVMTIAAQSTVPLVLAVPMCMLAVGSVAVWWAQRLRRDDPQAYEATVGRNTFRYFNLAFAAVMFVDYAAAFWLIPFAERRFGIGAGVAGSQLGGLMIAGGVAGCLAGGWLGDRWRQSRAAGRVWTALAAVVLEALAILVAIVQSDYATFTALFAVFCFASGAWAGVAAALAFDLVPAEHRGTATAAYFLTTTILGPGLGPFVIGLGSDLSGSVGVMLGWACSAILVAVFELILLGRQLEDEASARVSPPK